MTALISPLDVINQTDHVLYRDKYQSFQAQYRLRHRDSCKVTHLRKRLSLRLWGVFELRTWGGAGVSVLVCTRGAAFEMDWWKFGMFQ